MTVHSPLLNDIPVGKGRYSYLGECVCWGGGGGGGRKWEAKKAKLGYIPYTKQVALGAIWKAIFWTIPGFLDIFFKIVFIKWVLVSVKQMSSTPLSRWNLAFTICHIKAQTHWNTVGIDVPTGEFGQDLESAK